MRFDGALRIRKVLITALCHGLNKVSRGALLIPHADALVDVATCSSNTLRELRTQRIAMVFQQFGLLPWRSVRDSVGFGLEIRGLQDNEIRRIVDEKLALMHIQEWAGESVAELSGGMQQRVGLARAFATNGDILLMDEQFSALDPLIRNHLQDELLQLQQSLHKTILFVSHDLDEALKIGTRIVIMEAGRVVQQGSPEQIVLNPTNEYVRAFVANMNPMLVLNSGALMRQIEDIPKLGTMLDFGDVQMHLDNAGTLTSANQRDDTGAKVSLQIASLPAGMETSQAQKNCIPVARTDTKMRTLMETRRECGLPIAVMDNGVLLGMVGDRELFDGFLR